MKGFIRRRFDAWELRVLLGADPVTNKKRYASRTVRSGKCDAQRVLNEMVTGGAGSLRAHQRRVARAVVRVCGS